MKINIQNETHRLRTVVLGQPQSMGKAPGLSDTFDAKSYRAIMQGVYPIEKDIVAEMQAFENVLKKYEVEVIRPKVIQDYNQVFSRDVAFAIEDQLFISNIIPDRFPEQEAYRSLYDKIDWNKIVNLPPNVQVEGGDVLLWNDYIFVGTCYSEDYRNFKTARTNKAAVDALRDFFPDKRVIDLELVKDDKNPQIGILHLDCTFNMIGKDKCIIYEKGFVKSRDFELLVTIFGKENCFFVNEDEVVNMVPNVFSIAPDVVVSDKAFTRLNQHLRKAWDITVEEIPYREISKMGGLLRCSTMPLVRDR